MIEKHHAVANMILSSYIEGVATYTEATSQLLGAHSMAVRIAEADEVEPITTYHEECIDIILGIRKRN